GPGGGSHRAHRGQPLRGRGARAARVGAEGPETADGVIAAPMQAIITRICVEPGARVAEGDLLIVLESMKMENYVHAPYDGVVEEIAVGAGTTVSAGDVLIRFAREAATGQKEA
ncbi:acetyl-CoA carboxylase biotin carboxyl carrier protein subunit, partial [Actinomyces sp. zg328]